MLPPASAAKVTELLETLDLLDLQDLAGTSSGNQVAFDRGSRDDCIRVILAYHATASEILGRRKVKREYLIKHLWACGLSVSLSMNKTAAVVQLLNHWQVEEQAPAPQQLLGEQLEGQLEHRHVDVALHQQPQQSPGAGPADDEASFLGRLSNAFARWFFAAYHTPEGVPPEAFEAACDFSVALGGPAMPGGRIHRESHRSGQRASMGLSELARNYGYAMQPNLDSRSCDRSSFGLVRLTVDASLHHLPSGGACIGVTRLHCVLAPRLVGSQHAGQQQQLEHSYAIRSLCLLLSLESRAGVPACLLPQLQCDQRLAIGQS